MIEFLTIAAVAAAAGKSKRAVEIAAERIANGKSETWRGSRIVVRTVLGRGGRAGANYEIKFDSLPADIQERLKRHLTPVSTPAPTPATGDVGRLEREVRYNIISRVCAHPKGSEARAVAAREEAARSIINPRTEQFSRISVATIMRWVKRHEEHGEAGFRRRRPAATMSSRRH